MQSTTHNSGMLPAKRYMLLKSLSGNCRIRSCGLLVALIILGLAGAQQLVARQIPIDAKGLRLIETGKFCSPLLKRDLGFRVFGPETPTDKAMITVVYVKNPGFARIGTLSDSQLIGSFVKQGMLVVEVDYQGDSKAKGADMYSDIVHLYRVFGASRRTKPGSKAKIFGPLMDEFIGWDDSKVKTYDKFTADSRANKVEYKINPLWVYVIPAGYTIDRNVEICTIETGKRAVLHRMDVIHPAAPAKPVPAVLEISTRMPLSDTYFRARTKGSKLDEIVDIMPLEDPDKITRINRNSCYVSAWMMAGYAGVIMDNVANHVTSNWIYAKPMTVPTGPNFPEKRALRLLRGRKSHWGLSGKIAVMGISKCNMRAIMAGLINDEHPNHSYVKELDKGPYAKQSGRFDAMIAGGFPRRPLEHRMILDYLSEDDPPLVWCQSIYPNRMKRQKYVQQLLEKEAVLHQKIQKRCDAMGVPDRTFFRTPIGHDYDYVNLRDIISFIDSYLK
jgi:hypothetical protein